MSRPDPSENLAALQRLGAVLDGHFRYTSGRHGARYIEKFRLLEHPDITAQLCQQIADHFRPHQIDLVAGPTTGGILLAHETAKALGTRSFFAESNPDDTRYFGRGFTFEQDQPTLIVDDVLTTGGSIRHTIDAVRHAGGKPVGVGVVVDRTNGAANFDDLPFYACLSLDVPSWEPGPDTCPLCADNIPLIET